MSYFGKYPLEFALICAYTETLAHDIVRPQQLFFNSFALTVTTCEVFVPLRFSSLSWNTDSKGFSSKTKSGLVGWLGAVK